MERRSRRDDGPLFNRKTVLDLVIGYVAMATLLVLGITVDAAFAYAGAIGMAAMIALTFAVRGWALQEEPRGYGKRIVSEPASLTYLLLSPVFMIGFVLAMYSAVMTGGVLDIDIIERSDTIMRVGGIYGIGGMGYNLISYFYENRLQKKIVMREVAE